MLRFFGAHGPEADPAELDRLVTAMDRALDPTVYAAARDLSPAPALRLRLRAPDAAGLARGAADSGALTLVGRVRLYDEGGAPEDDLPRLAAMLAADREALERTPGAFGIIAWDAAEGRLRLATDAVGSLPVYYARIGKALVFANWPHLVLAAPGFAREIDPLTAAAFVASTPLPRDRTFFRGLLRLAPGETLTRGRDGAETLSTYWRPGPAANPAAGTIEGVRDAVETAIRARLHHATRPMLELSGGLDSTLVAGLAARLRPDLRFPAVSNVLPEGYAGAAEDERAYVEAALAHIPGLDPAFITSEGADILSGGADAWARMATPTLDHFGYMTEKSLAVAERVGADAILGGFGGDQCLSAHGGPFIYEMLTRGRIGAALRYWQAARRFYGVGHMRMLQARILMRLPFFATLRTLRRPPPALDALSPRAAAEPETKAFLARWGYRRHVTAERSMRALELEGLAAVEDWMTFDFDAPASGVSVAMLAPLIDTRVIEAAMAAPSALKVDGHRDRALARAIGGAWMPPEVAERMDKKPFAPDFLDQILLRRADISAGFARFRRHPLWREFVDVDAAEAALAEMDPAKGIEALDAAIGKIMRSYEFGAFLERAFPDR